MMKKPRRRPAARAAKTETLITIAEAAQLFIVGPRPSGVCVGRVSSKPN